MGDETNKTDIDKEMGSKTPWDLFRVEIPGDCEKEVFDKIIGMMEEIREKILVVEVIKDNLTTDLEEVKKTLKKIQEEVPEAEINFS